MRRDLILSEIITVYLSDFLLDLLHTHALGETKQRQQCQHQDWSKRHLVDKYLLKSNNSGSGRPKQFI